MTPVNEHVVVAVVLMVAAAFSMAPINKYRAVATVLHVKEDPEDSYEQELTQLELLLQGLEACNPAEVALCGMQRRCPPCQHGVSSISEVSATHATQLR